MVVQKLWGGLDLSGRAHVVTRVILGRSEVKLVPSEFISAIF